MFKNTFQSGFLSILYSIGSKPLQIWEKKVSRLASFLVHCQCLMATRVEHAQHMKGKLYMAKRAIKIAFMSSLFFFDRKVEGQLNKPLSLVKVGDNIKVHILSCFKMQSGFYCNFQY